jgi:hypothetical protein
MMYPLTVRYHKSDGSWSADTVDHGVHEGVATLINKMRSRHPEIDPNNECHLYPEEKTTGYGTKSSSNMLPEDGTRFLEDYGVKQSDHLYFCRPGEGW